MAVYVDKEKNPFGRMIMCHMLSDSEEELHAMAKKIGMRREWFQPKSAPHYDVCLSRRAKAIEFGAKEIDREQTVALIRKLREQSY